MNEMISEKTENEDTEPTTQHREHRLPFHNGAYINYLIRDMQERCYYMMHSVTFFTSPFFRDTTT